MCCQEDVIWFLVECEQCLYVVCGCIFDECYVVLLIVDEIGYGVVGCVDVGGVQC